MAGVKLKRTHQLKLSYKAQSGEKTLYKFMSYPKLGETNKLVVTLLGYNINTGEEMI